MTDIPIPPEAVEAAAKVAPAWRPTMCDVERMLAAAAPMIVGAQWVSVKERMPELHREVLAMELYAERPVCAYTLKTSRGIRWFQDKSECSVNGDGTIDNDLGEVTHWMPLPPPPHIDPEAT